MLRPLARIFAAIAALALPGPAALAQAPDKPEPGSM